MERYCLYGMSLVSDLAFPQLVKETEEYRRQHPDDWQIEIVKGKIPQDIRERTDVKYEFGDDFSWLVNSTAWIIVENGKRITYELKEGGRVDYLRSYLLGWGMSMLALQRGILAIHCSAVADEAGAILICGESGAGKSTVTTAFLEKGYRLMADDMAFVEVTEDGIAMASPAFLYQKLCRDAALAKGYHMENMIYIDEEKDKFLVPYTGNFSLYPVPVRGMCMLGIVSGKQVVSAKIKGMDQFHLVANNLFLRHLLGAKKYEPKIGQLCLKMAASVPCGFIGRPQKGDYIEAIMDSATEFLNEWTAEK